MGCWNQTCILSGLPIFSGEKIVSIFLARTQDKAIHDHCYAHAFYDPIPHLVYADYNDYGAAENFTGKFDHILIETLKRNAAPMDESSRDPAVVPEELDLEKIYDASHEHRLFAKDRMKRYGDRELTHVAIKRSLFDRILDETIIDQYTGDGYSYLKFSDLLHNTAAAAKYIRKTLMDKASFWGAVHTGKIMPDVDYSDVENCIGLEQEIEKMVRGGYHNTDAPPQASWLRKGDYSNPEDLWVWAFLNANEQDAEEILIERMKFTWLERWMDSARKTWFVPGHVGSQNGDMEPHKMLASFMLDEIKAHELEYGDYEEDEDEDEDTAEALASA